MKKILYSLIIASGLSFATHAAFGQEVQRYTFEAIERQAVASSQGSNYSFYNGAINFALPDSIISLQPSIEVRQLGIVPEGGMEIPEGYKNIAGVYQIEMGGVAVKKPISVSMAYTSNIKFDKIIMQYDEVKGNWKTLPSVTNISNSTVSFALTKSKIIITAVDTDALVYGNASWYRFKKCNCAASPDYPKGTLLLVTNLNKNQAIVVKVNDWGPERDLFPERVIDLDLVAFQKLGKKGMGVLTNIMVVPFHTEDFSVKEAKDLLAWKMIPLTGEKVTSLRPVATEAVASVPVPISQPITLPIQVPVIPVAPVVQQPVTNTNGWNGVGFYFLSN